MSRLRGAVQVLVALALALGVPDCAPWYRDDELRALRARDDALVDAILAEGERELAAGRASAALERFREAAEISPRRPQGFFGMARVYSVLKQPREARFCAEFALGLVATGTELDRQIRAFLVADFAAEGLYAVALDRLAPAEAPLDLDQVLAHPDLGAPYLLLGEARRLAAAGAEREALEKLAEWMASYGIPDHPRIREWVDQICEQIQPLTAFYEAEGQAALQTGQPVLAILRFGQAYRYRASTRFHEAIRTGLAAARVAAQGQPRLQLVATSHADEAEAALQQGQMGTALRAYRLAVAAAPEWPEVRHNLALCLAAVGLPSEAVLQMDWFLALDPSSQVAGEARRLRGEWAALTAGEAG